MCSHSAPVRTLGTQFDGDDLLGGPFGVEDREGDAFVKEVAVNAFLKPGQVLGSEFRQGRVEALARLSRTPVGSEHLIIVVRIQVVVCEDASFRCTTLRHTASGLRGLGGGADRDRTGDLLNAIQALSQLSYGPTPGNRKGHGPVKVPQPLSR